MVKDVNYFKRVIFDNKKSMSRNMQEFDKAIGSMKISREKLNKLLR